MQVSVMLKKLYALWQQVMTKFQALFQVLLLNHIIRAYLHFNARLGSNFSAAITYFFFLSLIPLLMLLFSLAGIVLATHPKILAEVIHGIVSFIREPHLDSMFESIIKTAIMQRTVVGVSGILIAMYSGVRLMSVLREAIIAQFSKRWPLQPFEKEPFYVAYPKNFLRLLGFGLVFILMIGVTSLKSTIRHDITWLFSSIDVINNYWFIFIIQGVTLIISILTNVILFIWLYRFLPPHQKLTRALWRGCGLGAIGLEGIKVLTVYIIPRLMHSPSGIAFGTIIGLLAILYLFAWLTLYCAAWIATSEQDKRSL